MKKHYLIALALSVCLARTTAAQITEEPTNRSLRIAATVGYNGFSLGEAADFHTSIVRTYTDTGLRVPMQRSFPSTMLLGFDVLYGSSNHVFGGLGVRYTSTDAFSLYGDYAGTIDVISTVRALSVDAIGLLELGNAGVVHPTFGSRLGLIFGRAKLEERLVIDQLDQAEATLEGSGRGFTAEGFGGVNVHLGPAILMTQLGYRFAFVKRLEGTASSNGFQTGEGLLPFGLGLSGFVGTVGIAFRIL